MKSMTFNNIEELKNREVAIYKIGKFQEDFEYIFDFLKLKYYVDNFSGEYKGSPVISIDEFLQKKDSKVLLIICQRNKRRELIEDYENRGLIHNKDFVFADELFWLLDYDWKRACNGRIIAFWGTGDQAERLFGLTANDGDYIVPDIYIDSDIKKSGKMYHGISICSPDDIIGNISQYFIVVMTEEYYFDVAELLIDKGCVEKKDFVSYKLLYERVERKPSEMLLTTIYDNPLKDQPFCTLPFNTAYTMLSGKVSPCCYINGMAELGNYYFEDIKGIWNSIKAKIFRLSILNSTYSFCGKERCEIMNPLLIEDFSVERRNPPQDNNCPDLVTMEIDGACNLKCPSCRKHGVYNDKGRENDKKMYIARKFDNSGWLDKSDTIMLAGHGEVFYSNVYRYLLYRDSKVKNNVIIQTNGMLFTEEEFQKIKDRYNDISVIISLDGVKKETYESLRPGGNFELLMRNIENISRHRKAGEIKFLKINFVVQRANYKEMEAMVPLCEELNADCLEFIQIVNWLYTPEEFANMNMANPDGTLKEELVEILKNPVFKSKIVKMPWFVNRMGI